MKQVCVCVCPCVCVCEIVLLPVVKHVLVSREMLICGLETWGREREREEERGRARQRGAARGRERERGEVGRR